MWENYVNPNYGEIMNENKEKKISTAVIRRLPRYFRYLRELIRNDIMRISSRELSERMNVTASQIRQDLNNFGGFGQQGYGYNVKSLYSEISHILGVDCGLNCIIVGMGNIGKALVNNPLFEKRGIKITGLFDSDPQVIGTTYNDLSVSDEKEMEAFCKNNRIDIAVIAIPKSCANETVERLAKYGIKGFWNFSNAEISIANSSDIFVENVHLGDSLMALCYNVCKSRSEKDQ